LQKACFLSYSQPTIKEIAKRLNVSVSTVSRALSNHPRIGLGTKEKVKKLAAELGYEPNLKAIQFKQKKSYIIGVIVPYIQEEFFSQAISGIETIALEHDYTILFGQSFDDPEREKKMVDAMRKQRVDGLIISLTKYTTKPDTFQAMEKINTPVIYFDRVPPFARVHKIYCNMYKATLDMIEWLFKKGYRRIGFINGPSKLAASQERMKGYMEGVSRQKLKVDMQLVEETDLSKESTDKAMKKLLSLKSRPTAIITFNDYVHMDAAQYAVHNNIRVNTDIAFVSYANLPINSHIAFPPLVSIEQFPFNQGKKAMEIMIDILNLDAKDETREKKFYSEEIPYRLNVLGNK
jgi:LacI family transcriptional regulator, repressor for deo operon, udp, cdd, tsx, nupC, and nupG